MIDGDGFSGRWRRRRPAARVPAVPRGCWPPPPSPAAAAAEEGKTEKEKRGREKSWFSILVSSKFHFNTTKGLLF